VRHAALGTDCTQLVLRDGRAVQFPAVPDSDGALHVHAALRRITQVEVDVVGELVTTRVRGIGHRRPCSVPITLETALALAVEGHACAVDLHEAGHANRTTTTDAATTDRVFFA